VTKVERLERRFEQISGAGKVWIPQWLSAVGFAEEIVEWKAIDRSYRGPGAHERTLEFQRKMREKHPHMPLTFDEQLERWAKRLEANPWLSWVQGLGPVLGADPVVDKIMAQLSIEERIHLSKAIRAFDEADAVPDAVLTASLETLADLPAEQRAAIEKARRLHGEQRDLSEVEQH
jgi:hypothetical protein